MLDGKYFKTWAAVLANSWQGALTAGACCLLLNEILTADRKFFCQEFFCFTFMKWDHTKYLYHTILFKSTNQYEKKVLPNDSAKHWAISYLKVGFHRYDFVTAKFYNFTLNIVNVVVWRRIGNVVIPGNVKQRIDINHWSSSKYLGLKHCLVRILAQLFSTNNRDCTIDWLLE